MRKYQLIGRKKALVKKKTQEYPETHICSLPLEILLLIFNTFKKDIKTLLNLSYTCTKFLTLLTKYFIYKSIRFSNSERLHSFAVNHLPSQMGSLSKRFGYNEPSNKIYFIEDVEFTNPPSRKLNNTKTSIAGSYRVETAVSKGDNYESFVSSFTSLIKEAYGLRQIAIGEISPSFGFPEDVNTESIFHTSWKKETPKRKLGKLILKAQSGWSIPFKYSHLTTLLSIYDTIGELVLHNFIIDNYKLTSNSNIPKNVTIQKLTLHSCVFTDTIRKMNKKKVPSPLFLNTSCLNLTNILSDNDLSVIDFIKGNGTLSSLAIDFSSKFLYEVSHNKKIFNFSRYNLFFELICSGKGQFSNLKDIVFTNFNLWDMFEHSDNKVDGDCWTINWEDNLNNNLEGFLSSLAPMRNIVFVLREKQLRLNTCIRCGHTESDINSKEDFNSPEWRFILQTLSTKNRHCNVKIFDHRANCIYKSDK